MSTPVPGAPKRSRAGARCRDDTAFDAADLFVAVDLDTPVDLVAVDLVPVDLVPVDLVPVDLVAVDLDAAAFFGAVGFFVASIGDSAFLVAGLIGEVWQNGPDRRRPGRAPVAALEPG
jgi:hypothetical protein